MNHRRKVGQGYLPGSTREDHVQAKAKANSLDAVGERRAKLRSPSNLRGIDALCAFQLVNRKVEGQIKY